MAGGIFRDISASYEATPLDYLILLFRYSKIHNNKNEKMNPDAVSLMDVPLAENLVKSITNMPNIPNMPHFDPFFCIMNFEISKK